MKIALKRVKTQKVDSSPTIIKPKLTKTSRRVSARVTVKVSLTRVSKFT